jgi:hypothetical protein
VRVPQAVQRHAIDLERLHRQGEFLREPMRRAHAAVKAGKEQILRPGAAEAEREAAPLLA